MLAIIVPNKIGNESYMIVYRLGKAQNLTKKNIYYKNTL